MIFKVPKGVPEFKWRSIPNYRENPRKDYGFTIYAAQYKAYRMLNAEKKERRELMEEILALIDLLPSCVKNALNVCNKNPN